MDSRYVGGKKGRRMKIKTNRDGTGLMPERLAPFAPKPPQVHIVYPSDNQLPGYVSHPYNHTADCLVSCIITSLNFEKHLWHGTGKSLALNSPLLFARQNNICYTLQIMIPSPTSTPTVHSHTFGRSVQSVQGYILHSCTHRQLVVAIKEQAKE